MRFTSDALPLPRKICIISIPNTKKLVLQILLLAKQLPFKDSFISSQHRYRCLSQGTEPHPPLLTTGPRHHKAVSLLKRHGNLFKL
jgi:hypothetical protein